MTPGSNKGHWSRAARVIRRRSHGGGATAPEDHQVNTRPLTLAVVNYGLRSLGEQWPVRAYLASAAVSLRGRAWQAR
jgi:hypothetical protein